MSLKYPEGMVPGDTIVDLLDRTKRLGQPHNIGVFVRQAENEDISSAIGRLTVFALADRGEKTMQELHAELQQLSPVMEFMLRITWEDPEPYVFELRLSEVQVVMFMHSLAEIFKGNKAMDALGMYAHSLGELLYPVTAGVQEHD